jgi:pyridinium-3,5-bisthiocarboxylic acid mononucleotide nickel chelatase
VTSVRRAGWVDCSAGVSGDMLLGALDDLGALAELPAVLAALPDLAVTVTRAEVTRGGLRGVHVDVEAADAQPLRHLPELLGLVGAMPLPAPVQERSRRVLERLADAESAVHGIDRSQVHFHEVGAVDTVVDVVGCCLGFHTLGLDRVTVSEIALGGGTVSTAHGTLPVPAPAVLELLRGSGLTGRGGPVDVELATPTGVALLAEHAGGTGPLPGMTVDAVGVGAGSRDLDGRPNLLRIVVGAPVADDAADGRWLLLEANVDDLDPRLWPTVLDQVLLAGAADAWLTPILMKKGRPAHTIAALVPGGAVDAVRTVLFRESSTIGIRSTPVSKTGLDRRWIEVDVAGQQVRVKLAVLDGAVVSATPEWEDVAAAAHALDRPAKWVLAAASAAARAALD